MRIRMEELLKQRRSHEELVQICEEYYFPLIKKFVHLNNHSSVLVIGCGEGGVLLPFAEYGCNIMGTDKDPYCIKRASDSFRKKNIAAQFIEYNEFLAKKLECKFDLIILNEMFEYIKNKQQFMEYISSLLKPHGIIFICFRPWQMPFNGDRYLCRHRFINILPYMHLLPESIYRYILNCAHEDEEVVYRLLEMKHRKLTIEYFKELTIECDLRIKAEKVCLIAPSYSVRYKLKPKELPGPISRIPYISNFFASGCVYILAKNNYRVQVI